MTFREWLDHPGPIGSLFDFPPFNDGEVACDFRVADATGSIIVFEAVSERARDWLVSAVEPGGTVEHGTSNPLPPSQGDPEA